MNTQMTQGDGASISAQRPSYDGLVASPYLSGEAKLEIDTDGLILSTLFEQVAISYANMQAITMETYSVCIQQNEGVLKISRMGASCEWFYRELLAAYYARVRAAFLIKNQQVFETKGQYEFEGQRGMATIQIFEDCLCILPPNEDGRRIPFAFMNGMRKENHCLTLGLSTGESYVLSKLGYDLEPLEKQIGIGIRGLREKNTNFIKKLDDSFNLVQLTQAARLLPEGIAASQKGLSAMPRLAVLLEKKISHIKMKESYVILQALCSSEQFHVGMQAVPEEVFEKLKADMLEKLSADSDSEGGAVELTPEQEDALRYRIWLAAPSKDKRAAVVEFAFPDEAAATYVFQLDTIWEEFLPQFNRAMEATQLQREIFSLSEEQLRDESKELYRMAMMRTHAVQFLRQAFVGRVVHHSPESWKRNLVNCMGQIPGLSTKENIVNSQERFCTACGVRLDDAIKFCGQCGKKI